MKRLKEAEIQILCKTYVAEIKIKMFTWGLGFRV